MGEAICRSPPQIRAQRIAGCGFYFYCGVVFLYSHFQPLPRLRITNRSPARTATKPVRVRTATSSGTGVASVHAFKSME